MLFYSKKNIKLDDTGEKSCRSGWSLEYWGYLMAELVGGHVQPTEYICADNQPSPLSDRDVDDGDGVVWLVGGVCGSLKCPPYVNEIPITCVVCSI